MRKLTIEALSRERAHALQTALKGFKAELVVDGDGNHSVVIPLTNGDAEARAVIAAISVFVEDNPES